MSGHPSSSHSAEVRRSPVYRELLADAPSHAPARGDASLTLADLSPHPRLGLRGRGAAGWLKALGVAVPERPNRALLQKDGSRVLRLGAGEFLVLADSAGAGDVWRKIASEPLGEGCYDVPARDSLFWFAAAGEKAPEAFSRLAALDLSPGAIAPGEIAQTRIAHISVVVLCEDGPNGRRYDLLGESASARYFWRCLTRTFAEFSFAYARM